MSEQQDRPNLPPPRPQGIQPPSKSVAGGNPTATPHVQRAKQKSAPPTSGRTIFLSIVGLLSFLASIPFWENGGIIVGIALVILLHIFAHLNQLLSNMAFYLKGIYEK